MTIKYGEPSHLAVKAEQDWRSEPLEMPINLYEDLLLFTKEFDKSVSEGDFESSKIKYEKIQASIAQSDIYEKRNYKHFIAKKYEPKLGSLNPTWRGMTYSTEPLIAKSKVREYIKSKNCVTSGDLIDGPALNNAIIDILDKAVARAKANKRKTVQEKDL